MTLLNGQKYRAKVKDTPAIQVKGHELTKGDELEDLVMIANAGITQKNILQDINGLSTMPLGAARELQRRQCNCETYKKYYE